MSDELEFSDAGALEEIAFWESVFQRLEEGGNQYIRDWLNPTRPLVEYAALHVKSVPSRQAISILDLGCGPVSVLGYTLGDRAISITGVDPLAKEYEKLCIRHRVRNPIQLVSGLAETLDQSFPSASFDFVNCANALDHCYDPRKSLRNIVHVLKENCVARIEVFVNEAEFAAYTGFHQWNFDVLGDRVIVWNRNEIEFFDDLIDGYPYRFERIPRLIGESQIKRETLTIEVYKVEPPSALQIKTPHGVQVSYSRERKILFFEKHGPVEPGNFFVHFLGIGERGFESASFRWTPPYRRRFLWVPDGVKGIKFGMFRQSYDHQQVVYSDVWAEEVPTQWFANQPSRVVSFS